MAGVNIHKVIYTHNILIFAQLLINVCLTTLALQVRDQFRGVKNKDWIQLMEAFYSDLRLSAAK